MRLTVRFALAKNKKFGDNRKDFSDAGVDE
jgi:hypothetical protein